jgi:hypothetical protein
MTRPSHPPGLDYSNFVIEDIDDDDRLLSDCFIKLLNDWRDANYVVEAA